MYGIVHSRKTHQRIRRSLQLAALDGLLPDGEVEGICRELGHRWRNRELPPRAIGDRYHIKRLTASAGEVRLRPCHA